MTNITINSDPSCRSFFDTPYIRHATLLSPFMRAIFSCCRHDDTIFAADILPRCYDARLLIPPCLPAALFSPHADVRRAAAPPATVTLMPIFSLSSLRYDAGNITLLRLVVFAACCRHAGHAIYACCFRRRFFALIFMLAAILRAFIRGALRMPVF